MLEDMLKNITTIYIAYGITDFRKQIIGLTSTVKNNFGKDPYNGSVYIFCNRKKDSIKILCYDKNGFVLAQKTLIEQQKFQWSRNSNELKNITKQQLKWLFEGLNIEQKRSFKEIEIRKEEVVI